VRGIAGYRKESSTVVGIGDSLFCCHTERKQQASRVACSMRVHWANIFSMGGQWELVIRQEILRTRYGIPGQRSSPNMWGVFREICKLPNENSFDP